MTEGIGADVVIWIICTISQKRDCSQKRKEKQQPQQPDRSLTRSITIPASEGGREHFWQPCGRRRKNDGVRVSPTHPLFARAWPCNVWHPSAHWETSRIAAIGPRAARYGRSRPHLTLAPFPALRTRARVEKEYLPTHPWAIGKTPARALRKWRATGVNQFADMANAVWRPSRKGLASRLAALARGARKSEPRARGIK